MRDSQRAPEPLGRRPQHALDVVVGVGRQRPMGADDTFRGTGGAGGENHVGRLVHRHRDGTVLLEYVSANRSGEHASSMTTGADVWRKISATRSPGIAGSSGTIMPPALRTASMAAT